MDSSYSIEGIYLPQGFVGLWSAQGFLFQLENPLDDESGRRRYLMWWFTHGQFVFPAIADDITDELLKKFHSLPISNKGEMEFGVTPLMHIYYLESDELKGAFQDLSNLNSVNEFWEWWIGVGCRNYKIPNYGAPYTDPSYVHNLRFNGNEVLELFCNTKTLFLYDRYRFLRENYDLNVVPGCYAFSNWVFNKLFMSSTKTLGVLSASSIKWLSKITNNFSNFERFEYQKLCFHLYSLEAYEENVAKEDIELWWLSNGKILFKDFSKKLLSLFAEEESESTKDKKVEISLLGYPAGQFGIGEDARLLEKAIKSLDCSSTTFQMPREIMAKKIPGESYPRLKTGLLNSRINIFCMPAFDCIAGLYDVGWDIVSSEYNIGFWQWELERFPDEAFTALNMVDEIWTISNFAAEAFRKVTRKKVSVVPMPVEITPFKPVVFDELESCNDTFKFLFVFDGASFINRKNPLNTIEAFQRTFVNDENVSLIIKSMNNIDSEIWNECLRRSLTDKRIIIIDRVLPRESLLSLIKASDCVISLHRAEGFGRLMAEAYLLDKPVIASNYSGNLDYMLNKDSLVNGDLVRIFKGEYSFYNKNSWFNPSIKDAGKKMFEVYSDPESSIISCVNSSKELLETKFSLLSFSEFVKNNFNRLM